MNSLLRSKGTCKVQGHSLGQRQYDHNDKRLVIIQCDHSLRHIDIKQV